MSLWYLLACAAFVAATIQCAQCDGCGRPSAKHPPNLSVSGDNILGIKAGIVGGEEAAPHSYPWVVTVTGCGGAIIDKKWVLTAAHCFVTNGVLDPYYSSGRFSINYDQHHRYNGARQMGVKRVITHPDYGRACDGGAGDLALVELKEELTFNERVQPICLPSASDDFHNQGNMVVAGWGDLAYEGDYPEKLRHVVVRTQQAKCVANYGAHNFNGQMEMCAAARGKSTCQGDSGGSLFGLVDGRYTAMGIVSCAVGCANEDYPTVYTHVPSYRQWIRDNAGV